MISDPAVKFGHSVDEKTLAALLQASAVINDALDLAATLQAIARSAAQVLDAEASSVLLLDKQRNKLVFKAAVGDRSDVLLGEEFNADLGIAGRVASTGQASLVQDVRHDDDFFRGIDDKSSFQTRGLIAAPLEYRGEVLGVVEVLNKRLRPKVTSSGAASAGDTASTGGAPPAVASSNGQFSPRDVEILRIFANLAAISVSNAQMHDRVKRENRGLREITRSDEAPIIGSSSSLKQVMELCDRVAASNATVLLLGETGTGKELTARSIHNRSPRMNKPFIAINCAALPETLLESELFGHEAGAFTGATAQKLGRFELADGGTMFLDEIGDISHAIQIKLLRVLQEREFVRVGGTKTIACNVRIIAATNRNLKEAMEKGTFRDDLYYRLNVFPIHLPPLRERRDDIPLLVNHFVEMMSKELGVGPPPVVTPEAMALLTAYRWPGNIRELRNVVERAVLLCDVGAITPAQLPREIAGEAADLPQPESDLHGLPADARQPYVVSESASLAGYEKAMIIKALRDNGWNQTRAAKALNITRDNLRYRLRKYQISRPDDE